MELKNQRGESTLFLVRIWAVEMSDGNSGWSGKVQHVVSGEAHTFRDQSELLACLAAMLISEVVHGGTNGGKKDEM
jgi:hypothetical protein